ncbi:hypothetical protein PCE1_003631 [Barthelona sp. PCE]
MVEIKQNEVSMRVRKFMTNPILSRKQMLVDVYHYGVKSTSAVSRKAIAERLSILYNVASPQLVHVFNVATAFGGGKTTCKAHIYDRVEDLEAIEPRFRRWRNLEEEQKKQLLDDRRSSRKTRVVRRSTKNKLKKFFKKPSKDKVAVKNS